MNRILDHHALAASVVAGIALVAAGCGGGHQTAPVTGTVTLDGKPAAGVVVEFVPARQGDRMLPPAYGFTDARGAYVARDRKGREGVVVGPNRVAILGQEGGAVVSEWYAGDGAFERDVNPGSNTLDFAIESNPATR